MKEEKTKMRKRGLQEWRKDQNKLNSIPILCSSMFNEYNDIAYILHLLRQICHFDRRKYLKIMKFRWGYAPLLTGVGIIY